MRKGANLGNWLVLEKWMSPELFSGAEADDETGLCAALGDVARQERFKTHRDSYITERDFALIAAAGIDTVRIPVPFFVFGGIEPFVGCIEYLDKAFDWAEAYGLQILLDLHTVPGSQNGFDNGGLCGVCVWHKHPDDVEFVVDLLGRLAARYGRRPGLWGIEALNEPVSAELWELADIPTRYPAADPALAAQSEPVPTELLKGFYRDAYQRIRAEAPNTTVIFHDGFRIDELADFFLGAGFENYIVDTHLYYMMFGFGTGPQDLGGYLDLTNSHFGRAVHPANGLPRIVGEWCLDTLTAGAPLPPEAERQSYYRQLADAQLRTWEHTEGWFFWSYKLSVEGRDHDAWDFGKSLALGYLPVTLAAEDEGRPTSSREGVVQAR